LRGRLFFKKGGGVNEAQALRVIRGISGFGLPDFDPDCVPLPSEPLADLFEKTTTTPTNEEYVANDKKQIEKKRKDFVCKMKAQNRKRKEEAKKRAKAFWIKEDIEKNPIYRKGYLAGMFRMIIKYDENNRKIREPSSAVSAPVHRDTTAYTPQTSMPFEFRKPADKRRITRSITTPKGQKRLQKQLTFPDPKSFNDQKTPKPSRKKVTFSASILVPTSPCPSKVVEAPAEPTAISNISQTSMEVYIQPEEIQSEGERCEVTSHLSCPNNNEGDGESEVLSDDASDSYPFTDEESDDESILEEPIASIKNLVSPISTQLSSPLRDDLRMTLDDLPQQSPFPYLSPANDFFLPSGEPEAQAVITPSTSINLIESPLGNEVVCWYNEVMQDYRGDYGDNFGEICERLESFMDLGLD
jgi:hypothetical protein